MKFDDIPVKHNFNQVPEEQMLSTLDQTTITGELNERLINTKWNIRVLAYDELNKLISSPEAKVDTYEKFLPFLPNMINDTNCTAQEKAVECLTTYLEKYEPSINMAYTLFNSIVEKCLTTSKSSLKAKANEFLLRLGEKESSFSKIYPKCLELLDSKQIKTVISTIQLINSYLANFGEEMFPYMNFINPLIKLANASNLHIKEESINFFKELCKWKVCNDDLIKPLKKAQIDEIQKFNSEMKDVVQPKRIIKNFQSSKSLGNEKNQKEESPIDLKVNEEEEEEKVKVDNTRTNEIKESIENDVFKQFNEAWSTQLLSKRKWTEKKSLLEDFISATKDIKIKPREYSYLNQMFKLLLNDNNINVINKSLVALGNLAKGLEKNYYNGARILFEQIFLKLKEKKSQVDAMNCVEDLMKSVSFDDIVDYVIDGLNDKLTFFRVNCILFIQNQIFKRGLSSKVEDKIIAILIKMTDDAAQEVRKVTLECLHYLKNQHISEINKNKINEISAKKWELLTNKNVNLLVSKSCTNLAKGASLTPMNTVPLSEFSKIEKVSSRNNSQESNGKNSNSENFPENIHISSAIRDIIAPDTFKLLSSENKIEVAKGFSLLTKWVSNNKDSVSSNIDNIIFFMKFRLKDWKESNMNLLLDGLNTIKEICRQLTISKKSANLIILGMTNLMTNSKISDIANEILLLLSENLTPDYVLNNIITILNNSNNIILLKASCNIFEKFLYNFSADKLPVQQIVNFVKARLHNTNPLVRQTVLQILVFLNNSLIESNINLMTYLEDLGESQRKMVEQELKKRADNNVVNIQRASRYDQEDSKGIEKDNTLNRVDISNYLTNSIIQDLSNKDWIKRKKALEEIIKIIDKYGKIKSKGIEALLVAIKERLDDPNKNLLRNFITFSGKLASAIGPSIKIHSKMILLPLLKNLSDKITNIRSEVISTLDQFADVIGSDYIINIMSPILISENYDLKYEILKWIIKKKDSLPKIDSKSLAAGIIFCIQDKGKDLRDLAEELMRNCIKIFGNKIFYKEIQDLKPAMKQTISSIIEKYCQQNDLGQSASNSNLHSNVEQSPIYIKTLDKNEKSKSFRIELDENENENKEDEEKNENPLNYISNDENLEDKLNNTNPNFASKSNNHTQNKKEKEIVNMENINLNNNLNQFSLSISNDNSIPEGLLIQPTIDNPLNWPNRNQIEQNLLIAKTNYLKDKINDKKNKWPIDEVKEPYIEKLKGMLGHIFPKLICEKLFSGNSLRQVESLKEIYELFCSDINKYINHIDLCYKIVWYSLSDIKNGSLIKQSVLFLNQINTFLHKINKENVEIDQTFIITLLIEKIAIIGEKYKEDLKESLRQLFNIFNPTKLVNMLLISLNSKNSKTRLEVIEFLKYVINLYGIIVINPRDLKAISKFSINAELALKQAIFEVIAQIYKVKKDDIWVFLPDISKDDQKVIENLSEDKTKKNNEPKLSDSSELAKGINNIGLEDVKPPSTFCGFGMGTPKFASILNKQRLTEGPAEFIEDSVPNAFRFSLSGPQSKSIVKLENVQKVEEEQKSQIHQINKHLEQSNTASKLQIPITSIDSISGSQAINPHEFEQMINMLKGSNDNCGKIKSLLYIYDLINQSNDIVISFLIGNLEILITTFNTCISEQIERTLKDLDFKFLRYLLSILFRIFNSKRIVKNINEKLIKVLLNNMLEAIMKDDIDLITPPNSDSKKVNEGEEIKKLVNCIILKIIENCDINNVIIAFIHLMDISLNPGKNPKLMGLVVKCLLKITRQLDQVQLSINLQLILQSLNEFMVDHFKISSVRSQNEEFAIRMIKTMLNEFVKKFKEQTEACYIKAMSTQSNVDPNMKRWISILIQSINTFGFIGTTPPSLSQTVKSFQKDQTLSNESQMPNTPDKLSHLLEGVNKSDNFSGSINLIADFSIKNPDVDIKSRICTFFKTPKFAEFVNSSLDRIIKERASCPNLQELYPQDSQIKKENQIEFGSIKKQKINAEGQSQSIADRNEQIMAILDSVKKQRMAQDKKDIS